MDNNPKQQRCQMCCELSNSLYTFSCDHTICYHCLYKLIISSYINQILSSSTITVQCLCQSGDLTLTYAQITSFLNSLLSNPKTHSTTIQQEPIILTCLSHPKNKQNFICLDCKADICEKCYLYKNTPHYNHLVVDIKSYVSSLRSRLAHLPNLTTILNKHITQIESSYEMYCDKINRDFDKLINEINNYKKRVLTKVKEKVEAYKQPMHVINLLYRYFNTEFIHLSNDVHHLLFLAHVKISLPEIIYHTNKTDRDLIQINQVVSKLNVENLTELKLNDKLINFGNAQTLKHPEQHEIYSVTLMDKLRLIAGDERGNILVFKMTKKGFELNQKLNTFTSHIQTITKLNKNRFVTCSQSDSFIPVFHENINIYEQLQTINLNDDIKPITLTSSYNKEDIFIVCNDSTIKLFKLNSYSQYEQHHSFQSSFSEVTCIVQLKNECILTSTNDNNLLLYKKDNYDNNSEISGYKGVLNTIIEMDDDMFAVAGTEPCIYVFKKKEGNELVYEVIQELKGLPMGVSCLLYLNDGRLVSGGEEGFIKVWIQNKDGKFEVDWTFREHEGEITGLTNIEDNTIISCSLDKTINIYLGVKYLK